MGLRVGKALMGRQALGALVGQLGPGQTFVKTGPRPCPYGAGSTVTRTEPDEGVALRWDAKRWGEGS